MTARNHARVRSLPRGRLHRDARSSTGKGCRRHLFHGQRGHRVCESARDPQGLPARETATARCRFAARLGARVLHGTPYPAHLVPALGTPQARFQARRLTLVDCHIFLPPKRLVVLMVQARARLDNGGVEPSRERAMPRLLFRGAQPRRAGPVTAKAFMGSWCFRSRNMAPGGPRGFRSSEPRNEEPGECLSRRRKASPWP